MLLVEHPPDPLCHLGLLLLEVCFRFLEKPFQRRAWRLGLLGPLSLSAGLPGYLGEKYRTSSLFYCLFPFLLLGSESGGCFRIAATFAVCQGRPNG
jgi:hypothetical protein